MKKVVSYLVIIMLALTLVFTFSTVAFAADDLSFRLILSPTSLTKEGNVAIKAEFTNAGDVAATNVVLKYPANFTASEIPIGDIAPGVKGFVGHDNKSWFISEEMFNQDLAFTLTYSGVSTDGAPVTKTQTASVKIEKKAEDVKVTGSASSDKSEAKKDERVKFTFKLKNEGNVKLENAKLLAPPIENGSQIGDTFSLDAGATKTMNYTVPVVADMEIKPVFSYTAAGKEGKTSLDTIKVKVEGSALPSATQSGAPSGSGGLVAVLVSDAASSGAATGDDVVFSLDVNNAGTATVSDLSAVDSSGNAISLSSTTLKPGESATGTSTVKVTSAGMYTVDVLGKDSKGNAIMLSSNGVDIKITEPSASPSPSMDLSKVLKLKVGVSSATLKKPGTVDFTISVINQSQETLSNVVVKETSLGTIGTLAQLSAGIEEVFPVKTAEITETTPFNFTASAQMPDGSVVETTIVPAVEIKVESGGSGGFELNPMLLIIIIAIIVVAVALVLYLLLQKKKGKLFGATAKTSSGKTVGNNFRNERPKPQYASEREMPRGKPRETTAAIKRESAKTQDRREDLYNQRIDAEREEYNDMMDQTQRVPRQKSEIYSIEPKEEMPRKQSSIPQERPQQPQRSAPVERAQQPMRNAEMEREPQSTRRPIGVTPNPAPQAPKAPVKKDRNNF